jgi:hypothetical protein
MKYLGGLVLVLFASSALAAPADDEPCPKRGGNPTTLVRRIGLYGRVYPHELGRVWYSTKNFNVVMDDGRIIEKLPAADVPKGFLAIALQSWFVEHDKAIYRIDRRTKAETKLADLDNRVAFAQEYGALFYWATVGSKTGVLRRVAPTGGTPETLWTGKGVNVVVIEAGTIIVADGTTVTSIPHSALPGTKPLQLAKGLKHVRALAADATHVYILDGGTKPNQGTILRVPKQGGALEKLAGSLASPTVIAVDDDRVYVMGDGTGDVSTIPKTGGKPTVLIPTPPNDWACRTTAWIDVSARGLTYLRMSKGWDTRTGELIDWGTLWSLPAAGLKDPQQQYRDWAATKGGTAGEPGEQPTD